MSVAGVEEENTAISLLIAMFLPVYPHIQCFWTKCIYSVEDY